MRWPRGSHSSPNLGEWVALALSVVLRSDTPYVDAAAAGSPAMGYVQEVYLELSIGKSIPLDWTAGSAEYSLAVPWDAPLVALRVETMRSEEGEGGALGSVAATLALRVPLRNLAFGLEPGRPSVYVDVGTEERTVLKLDIAEYEFTINVIRAKTTSTGQGQHPDPAQRFPALATLSGLALQDSLGDPAHMAWFTPRSSCYYASVGQAASHIRLVATPNDPDAELEWRRDGGKWDFLVSGLTSAPARISAYGWTLFEVRVRSVAAAVAEPLLYQIAVTKDVVCHPKCRACDGPAFDQCTSCHAPLLLHEGRCIYTACRASGKYFNPTQEQCVQCDVTCVECMDGSPQTCTVCPPMRFLHTASATDVAGQCIAACPFGFFVQPVSQSCMRAPVGVRLEKFYFRLDLRISAADYLEQRDLPLRILQVAVETLRVSSQDVRFHRWEQVVYGQGILYYFEVENPFLRRDKVEKQTTIDDWFAVLPVPVDKVMVLTYTQLYPDPPRAKAPPLLEPWMWGLIGAGVTGCLILYPLYHMYFIRKYWEKTPFKPKRDKEAIFVQEIIKNAKEEHITRAQKLADAPR
mmetsp:Transcript_166222/g.533698  ORF Transcript_166222/g.533698 Transcript_166222/m.533698 type:complete len:578 (-) Transcript_166222:457-2190(-)